MANNFGGAAPNALSLGWTDYSNPNTGTILGKDSATNTWYGEGPTSSNPAASMPTASDYYFGGGGGGGDSAPTSFPTMSGGNGSMSEGLPWNTPAPQRLGGGGSIDVSNVGNVSVPQGPLWQRYQDILTNPSHAAADPLYQFLQQQGEQALGRSAGARRMRFSGGTMLDFQKQGEGLASQYLQQLLPQLNTGAQQEYAMNTNQARAKAQQTNEAGLQADPYGYGRKAYAQYRSPEEYATAVGAKSPQAYQGAVKEWNIGKQLAGA